MDRDTLKLDYLSKLHSTLLETGRAVNRDMIWCMLLSFVIIILSSGLAVVDSKITLLGLNLGVPTWFIPFCTGWLLTFIFVRMLGLTFHDDRILKTILRLYRELGYDDTSLKATELSPLEHPNIMSLIGSKENLPIGRASNLLAVLFVAAIFLFPFIAQVFLACRMFITLGPNWWLILAFLLMLSLMLFYLSAFIRGMVSLGGTEPRITGDA